MIDPISLLLFVAGAVGTTVVVATYWEEIRAWVKEIYHALPPSIQQTLKGAISLIQKLANSIKNVMKYYSYNSQTNKWTETIVSKDVDESTVPEHIRMKLHHTNEVDTTKDLEREIKLTLS